MEDMVELAFSITAVFTADKFRYNHGAYSFGIHQHIINLHRTIKYVIKYTRFSYQTIKILCTSVFGR